MNTEIVMRVGLGSDGSGIRYLSEGWSGNEPDGTWSLGATSTIALGELTTGFNHIIELIARPFINRPFVPRQTIRASVGGFVVGEADIDKFTYLGFRIPAALLAKDTPVVLTLHHPLAARPCDSFVTTDDRWLGIKYERLRVFRLPHTPQWSGTADARAPFDTFDPTLDAGRTGPPDSAMTDAIRRGLRLTPMQLIMQFESVGSNCEFGLVQRRCGAEPLGLLRYSSTPLHKLLLGLETGFEGLGNPETIEPQLNGARRPREYMIKETKYELIYHTFHYEDQMDMDTVRKQETLRLRFLRRKFLEDLEAGAKILVYKRHPNLSEAEILPLLAAVGQRGPNTVLWVEEAEAGRQPGSVEVVADRLIKGYIDRFAPGENAHDLSLNCWLQLCANAYAIWQERDRTEQ